MGILLAQPVKGVEKIMKKVLMVLGSVLVIFLTACSNNEIPVDYEIYEQNEGHFVVISEQPVTNIASDYFIYANVDDLANSATDIFRGEVLDVRVEYRNVALPLEAILDMIDEELTDEVLSMWFPTYFGGGVEAIVIESQYEVVTINRILVLEVFQGEYQVGEIIEIMQSGGAYGSMIVNSTTSLTLDIGEDLVFFAHTWSHLERPSVLLNPFQSVYRVPAGIDYILAATSDELGIRLENLFIGNNPSNFEITIGDLIDMINR